MLARSQRVKVGPSSVCDPWWKPLVERGGGALAEWPNRKFCGCARSPFAGFDQEREDQVAEGTYTELVRSGGLSVDAGRAVPSVALLLARIWAWEACGPCE